METLLSRHMDVVFFACGLALAAMGIAALAKSRRERMLASGTVRKLEADIGGISETHEALRRSYEFNRAVLDGIHDSIAVIDAATLRITDVNAAFLREVGRGRDETVGKTCHEVAHGRSEPCAPPDGPCPLASLFSSGSPATVEHVHNDGGGGRRIVEVSVSPLRDEAGRIARIIHISRDITERKASEAELLRKHEKLQALFNQVARMGKEWELSMDCTSDMILMIDEAGRIRRCNRTMRDFTGLSYADILQRDWRALLGGLGLPVENEPAGTPTRSAELRHERSERWFAMHSYSYQDETRGLAGTVLTFHDITQMKNMTAVLESQHRDLERAYKDLKVAQSQIIQQEKMASIGLLAAGVAHEINNPTGFVMSNLGSLQKYANRLTEFIRIQGEALAALPEGSVRDVAERRKSLKVDYLLDDLAKLVKESLDGMDRIKKIVQDLKSFSRADASELSMADINAGLESTVNIVWNELKYKASVTKEYGDLPLTKCNPGHLNQVFMNILVNAAHAIQKQGEIRIRSWAGNGLINVSITDTGCGIPQDRMRRIFEPFYTTKEVGKGTGLGLSIAYDIVKKHDGKIEVESEVGKGTTFTVSIPVREEPRTVPSPA